MPEPPMPTQPDAGRDRGTAAAFERLRFGLALLVVSVGAGVFAVVFRLSLSWVYRHAYHAGNVVQAITGLPRWLRFVVPVAGAAVAGALSGWRMSRTQGVSNVMEAVVLGNVRLSLRTTARRVAGSWSAIATGLSIGREGPLIEFGGSLGAVAGRVGVVSLERSRILVAAGTAAGFAAAYNTPFAAVLFVLETIVGIVALDALLPAIFATVVATTLTRAVAGGGPIYGEHLFTIASPVELLSYAMLGVAAVGAAAAFRRALAAGEALVKRYPLPQPWRAAVGGALVGSIAMFVPNVAGNGYEPLNLILDQQLLAAAMLWLVVTKIIATTGVVASGVPGGMFTPVLLVGGALGSLSAPALQWLGFPVVGSPGSYALVGMAATAAATIHAPLTAAVMVFELTGDYPIVLPLLLSTVMATWLSRTLGGESVYDAELRRRGLGWELTLDGRQMDAPDERQADGPRR
jgi:CIC family chloride channel protein